MGKLILACALGVCCIATPLAAAEPAARDISRGVFVFQPKDDQKNVPERYRLGKHQLSFELTRKRDLAESEIGIYHLTFPSTVASDCKENNTVHAEYYRPKGKGPFPGVIVLDITAGNQVLSRTIAAQLAQNQIAALFVQMAYYGPRRPPGSKLRLMSPDVKHTLEAIRQTVLDVRCASAWLESRPEIDPGHLAILGTSLGSFIGTLTAEMEPRLKRVVVLLGGGALVDAYYDDPRAKPFRDIWERLGGNKEKLTRIIAPVDPITCAANLKDRSILIVAGKRDDVVPPKAAEALWRATGKQKILWYDCTHVGAGLYFVPILANVIKYLKAA